MLINHDEYRKMFETEEQLWWYRILHEKVINKIEEYFGENKTIKILDAGCGTGGMMLKLKKMGYPNLVGFDFSGDAVDFCKNRNLEVSKIDILNFDERLGNQNFDLIINNDVIYQFEEEEILKCYSNLVKILKPNGIIITNNQAFRIFRGTHDIAVGAKQRFTISDFDEFSKKKGLKILFYSYWSFFLSPLILLVRLFQQIQLKFNLVDLKKIQSDVEVPSNWMNNLFYSIVKLEERIFKKSLFGSSLFLVLKKVTP